jgi:DNA replication and repair protein RecF
MVLRNLRLVNFRKYTDSYFEFNDRINFINGNNGSGKTSILEGVHYLSLAKSFRTNNDTEAVNYQSDYFNIFGELSDRKKSTMLFNMNFTRADGRSFLLDKTRVKRYTDVVGYAPVVILSPGFQKITEGGPSERRNFINRIISQVDRNYFLKLIEYKKRISQRNTVLNRYREKNNRSYDAYFEAQDEIIAKLGADLYIGREEFVDSYRLVFKTVFARINHSGVQVDIRIKPAVKAKNDQYQQKLLANLKERFVRDLCNGRTGTGPHLDDVYIDFNGREIRQIGSQGEHKLVLIALKLAEGVFLESHKNEPIIFLLDDLFAFLDADHCRKIVEEIGGSNQTLITSTDIKELQKYGLKKTLSGARIINQTEGEA